jgi:uncharacterized protein (TIGR01777 family)
MKIALSGANGYIGGNLVQSLKNSGHQVIFIKRSALFDIPVLQKTLSETEVVIHLSGAPILCRWTEENKKEILRSRVESTRNIVQVINNLPDENRPHTFISASAIGIYLPGQKHNEESNSLANDFLGNVVKQWEDASSELMESVRKINFRIGLVLGKEAKMMKQLLPLFKMGLGGKIGNGKQAFPFVHINDVGQAFNWAVQNQEASGIYNLVAPETITNDQFTKALAKAVKRPAIFTVPEFALKIRYGEAAALLLQSPTVEPKRLIQSGFVFKYPDIKTTLGEITA